MVDPLAEKYYGWSPFNYVANNPLRFVDPDGREIVDANGKPITYDKKKGWSSNATIDVKIIHSTLMESETGRGQWFKAYNSTSKIEMCLVDKKLFSPETGIPSLGQADQALIFNPETVRNEKTADAMKIELSIPHITESLNGENKGLTLRQAIAAVAGHEIEHTTEENRDLRIGSLNFPGLHTKDELEAKPENIEAKIKEESRSQNSKLRMDPIKF